MKIQDIYPNFDKCRIKTFDDSWQRRQHLVVELEKEQQQLKKLNEDWAGIFFSINPMKDYKISTANISGLSAWICECDDLSKKEQQQLIKSCPLKPSMIVESNKSYHMYWFGENATFEKWKWICWWLAKYFSWDKKVIDFARVLRLPWYNHMKKPNNPFMCELIYGKNIKYTEQQMIEAYWYIEKEKAQIKKYKQDDNIRDDISSWDNMDMLQDLSWTRLMNGEQITFSRNCNWTNQILVDWNSTSCWIDSAWLIGSTDKWWPTWIQWIQRYRNINKSDLLKYCKERYPDRFKKFEAKQIKETPTVEWKAIDREHKDIYFSRGFESVDKKLAMISRNDLVLLAWFPSSGKTEYIYNIARRNAKQWVKIVYFTLELPVHDMKERVCIKRIWLDYYNFQIWNYTKEQEQRMNEIYTELDQENLTMINYETTPTIEVLIEKMKDYEKKWTDYFIIDTLGNIDWSNSENERLEKITKTLQSYKNNNRPWVILIHHLNKPKKWEESNPWWPARIRWTQKIFDNSTIVCEIYRDLDPDADDEQKSKVKICQYKRTKWGNTWECDIYFHNWEYYPEYWNW